MSTLPKRRYSVDEYMDFEHASSEKHEYFQGEIFAMTGGSRPHNRIAVNILGWLFQQLQGKPCTPLGSDTRIKVAATGLYTYPDVSVACEPIEYELARLETLLNPKVLVEVLSPSTADYDLGTKLFHYRQIPSLTEMLFVDQNTFSVTHEVRGQVGSWTPTIVTGEGGVVELASVGCRLTMRQIYEGVVITTE